MKFSLREVYYYLVSFVTLMMVIIGLYQLVNAGIGLFEPLPPYAERLESRTELELRSKERFPQATDEQIARLVDEELAARRHEVEARQNYWRWRRLIESLAFIAIAFPIYRYHWRLVREYERRDAGGAAP